MRPKMIAYVLLAALIVVLVVLPAIKWGGSETEQYAKAKALAERLSGELTKCLTNATVDVSPIVVPVSFFRRDSSLIVRLSPDEVTRYNQIEGELRTACQRVPPLVFKGNGSNWKPSATREEVSVWLETRDGQRSQTLPK